MVIFVVYNVGDFETGFSQRQLSTTSYNMTVNVCVKTLKL